MNIDKFGHHIHKRMRFSELFSFTDNSLMKIGGEYDLKHTRLKGVKLPTTSDDAANKEYVDNAGRIFYRKDDTLALVEAIKPEIAKFLHHSLKDYYTKSEVNKIVQLVKK